MARTRVAEAVQTLEQGSITFLYRPRVEDEPDVQRLLILLTPDGSAFERLIAVGRKRLPRSAQHDRFWGFVDLVLTPDDMQSALGAQVYGLRHLPAARPFAEGTYEVETHGPHSHLRWSIERFAEEVPIEHDADYILTIANPDPALWGLVESPDLQSELFDDLEMHVPVPTPFPLALQQRFRNRKFTQLDTIEWLDHPGAELVFIGAGQPTRLYPR
jgi:hypothetical protein